MARSLVPEPQREKATWWRITVSALGGAALVSLALEYGFETPVLPLRVLVAVQVAAVTAYILTVIMLVVTAPSRRAALRRHGWELVIILAGLLLFWAEYEARHQRILKAGTLYVGSVQVMLVVRFLIGVVRWNLEMSQRQLHPSRLILILFVLVITIGGCLLSLPKALTPEARERMLAVHEDESAESNVTRHIVGGFFTATSAACVTGLVVYDTEKDFNRFGQIVILVLIQLGGLGIMIFASLFGVLAGRQLSLRQSLVLQDAYSQQTIGQMRSTVRFIVFVTFASELVGAAICYPEFAARHPGFLEPAFQSVFHAVSAFCNAGFALRTESLVTLQDTWCVYLSIMPLIIIGGLGFPALQDLWANLLAWIRVRRGHRGPRYRLRLHTRIVLITTVLLIVGGAGFLYLFETIGPQTPLSSIDPHSMAGMGTFARVRAALFQSVTARTAGFNTVPIDINSMSPASHALLMMLMFVGGSPASTAGGIKTAALAVLLLSVIGTLRRRNRAEAFGRTVPLAVIERAGVVVILMGALVAITTLGLLVTTPGTLRELLFEATSACGTVGLSTGITAKLTVPAQTIIMLAMFAGRLGPLTILIALAGGEPPARYAYPEEQVTIG
ncbi:MAG: TrkH family potassium uptake protein [Phycisphaerales bacterium]|nr:TrkH family potassium uptake protein [Phycisphaerales bacterium]